MAILFAENYYKEEASFFLHIEIWDIYKPGTYC